MPREERQPDFPKEQLLEKYPFSKHMLSNATIDRDWANEFDRLFINIENTANLRLGSAWDEPTIGTILMMANDQEFFSPEHSQIHKFKIEKILFFMGYEMGDDSYEFIEEMMKKGIEYKFLNTESASSPEGQEKLGGIIKNIFDSANFYKSLEYSPFREKHKPISPLAPAVIDAINKMENIDGV